MQNIDNQIINLLKRNNTKIGDTIPSIRNFQNILGISRTATCSALKSLCEQNIIEKGSSARLGYILMKDLNSDSMGLSTVNRVLYILPFDSSSFVMNQYLLAFEKIFLQNGTILNFNNTNNSIYEENRLLSLIQSDSHPYSPTQLIFSTCNSANNINVSLIRKIQDKMPVLLFDRRIESVESSFLGTDNRYIGFKSAQILIENGHNNIVFVSGMQNISPIYERYYGFCNAMRAYGMPNANVMWLNTDGNGAVQEIQKSIHTVCKNIFGMKNRPTAIICGYDRIAVALTIYLQSIGISVPEDVSIISCDNDKNVLDMSPIKICTFEHPFNQLVEDAVEMLNNGNALQTREYTSKYIPGNSIKNLKNNF